LVLLAAVYYLYRYNEVAKTYIDRAMASITQTLSSWGIMPNALVAEKAEATHLDITMLVAKLKILDAKFYGTMQCTWTAQQLEAFPQSDREAVRKSIFVDCAAPGDHCKAVTHYPTWKIGGELMPPGMVPLAVLNSQCDAFLIRNESNRSNQKKDIDTDTPITSPRAEELQTPPMPAPIAGEVPYLAGDVDPATLPAETEEPEEPEATEEPEVAEEPEATKEPEEPEAMEAPKVTEDPVVEAQEPEEPKKSKPRRKQRAIQPKSK
jgi:hypothetical protein